MEEYSNIVRTLLEKRGICDKNDIHSFLNPSYDRDLHDPFLMFGMRDAVYRILQSIKKGDRIAIYGDFDADGIPAGVILHDFFKQIGFDNFTNYIPDRDIEGYGFHKDAIDILSGDNVDLIITVDVGITAKDTVSYAKSVGIDVIITDHHEPVEYNEIKDAVAILNPKQKSCKYPFKELCGAGVAFKLIQGLVKEYANICEDDLFKTRYRPFIEGREKWLLDMVAIATISDMVPLLGENRTLAYWGLHVLRKSPRYGVRALCEKLRIDQRMLDENDIGFSIGPRINAASRMGQSRLAFELLTARSMREARDVVDKLEKLNNKRKVAVANITKKVKSKIKKIEDALEYEGKDLESLPSVLVFGDPEWNPALVGLSAGKIADSLNRVVCLWGRDGSGVLKGSCRNGGLKCSVVHMFEKSSSVLTKFGGHHSAGGFSTNETNVHFLQDMFNSAVQSGMCEKDEVSEDNGIEYDLSLTLNDANEQVCYEINKLSPFGMGNPKPIICFENVELRKIRQFGKDNNHLEVYVSDNSGNVCKASKFFASAEDFKSDLKEGRRISLLAHLEFSNFAGRRSLELRIVDIMR